jgi:hypothetical protein
MSESSREDVPTSGADDSERETPGAPETGLISDEQLPDDLQPGKNPLARDPGEESDVTDEATGGDDTKVEGMPDMGEPGAGA